MHLQWSIALKGLNSLKTDVILKHHQAPLFCFFGQWNTVVALVSGRHLCDVTVINAYGQMSGIMEWEGRAGRAIALPLFLLGWIF